MPRFNFNPLNLFGLLGGNTPSPNIPPGGIPMGTSYPPGMTPNVPMPVGGQAPNAPAPGPVPSGPASPSAPSGKPSEQGKKGGIFSPQITAIDTTNPNAKPIIEMIQKFLMAQAQRGGQPQRRAPGPMSQLYPRGVPMAPFDPVNAGSTQIRSYQPQYMNQYTANNFDPQELIRSL